MLELPRQHGPEVRAGRKAGEAATEAIPARAVSADGTGQESPRARRPEGLGARRWVVDLCAASWSRRNAYGPTSRDRCTDRAPISAASSGRTSSGAPTSTRSPVTRRRSDSARSTRRSSMSWVRGSEACRPWSSRWSRQNSVTTRLGVGGECRGHRRVVVSADRAEARGSRSSEQPRRRCLAVVEFDELYINQIGPEQDPFFAAYRDEVLPRVR